MKVCTIPGCTRKHKAVGLCGTHYWRSRRGLDLTAPVRVVTAGGKPCTAEGCDRRAVGRGLCRMHLSRWRRHGDPHVTLRDWGQGKTAAVVSYGGAHRRVSAAKGRAREHECVSCGRRAAHWAYMGTDPDELTEEMVVRGNPHRLTYSMDPEHYRPMCQGCHQALDRELATHCGRGHEFTPENTFTRKDGGRECRACIAIRNTKQYRQRTKEAD